MTKINPKSLSWSAPTEDTQGNPITEPLNYTLGVDGAETVSFPGTLNADGKYSVAFSDFEITDGAHTLALKAFYTSNPELASGWSNSAYVLLGVGAPKAPFGLAAE